MRITLIINDCHLATSFGLFCICYFILGERPPKKGSASARTDWRLCLETNATTPRQAFAGPARTNKSHSLACIPKALRTTFRLLVRIVLVPGGDNSIFPVLIK